MKFRSVYFLFLFLASLCFAETPIPGKSLTDVGRGKPVLTRSSADDAILVPFQARHLKNAKVLWVNWDLLREKGIEFPKEGLTPQFETEVLESFAYAVPRVNDDL